MHQKIVLWSHNSYSDDTIYTVIKLGLSDKMRQFVSFKYEKVLCYIYIKKNKR